MRASGFPSTRRTRRITSRAPSTTRVSSMAVTHSWEALFAERTRGGGGDGIIAILGLLGNPDLISFAGGFPDPLTFPAERVAELVQSLDAAAFQYAPTQGLAGTLEAVAGRLESLQARRPSDDELLI